MGDPMIDITTPMRDVGVHVRIQQAVEKIAAERQVIPFEGSSTPYVGFVGEAGTQIAFYANRPVLDFALDPDDARRWADRLGVDALKLQNATAYVRVPAGLIGGKIAMSDLVELGLEAVNRNVQRREHRGGGQRIDDGYDPSTICPRHHIEVAAGTGLCDDCN
jgi:hypothetical protein